MGYYADAATENGQTVIYLSSSSPAVGHYSVKGSRQHIQQAILTPKQVDYPYSESGIIKCKFQKGENPMDPFPVDGRLKVTGVRVVNGESVTLEDALRVRNP